MDNTPSTEEILNAFKKNAEQADSLKKLMESYLGEKPKPAAKAQEPAPKQSSLGLSLETLTAYRKANNHGALIDALQIMAILSDNPAYLQRKAVVKMSKVWEVPYLTAIRRMRKVKNSGLLDVGRHNGRDGVSVTWA